MLYRPPKQAKRTAKTRRNKVRVRLETQDAFKFLAKLKPASVDLIVSSPPYCMGKEYDTSTSLDDFIADHEKLAPLLVRILKDGGSLCWQVGHHVKNGVVVHSTRWSTESSQSRKSFSSVIALFGPLGMVSTPAADSVDDMRQSSGLQKGATTTSILMRYGCHRNILASVITRGRRRVNGAGIHWERIRPTCGKFRT
jgi:hypothetical protein